MTISDKVRAFHARVAGTRIRGQTVENVDVSIDSNGDGGSLRYFVTVNFREPELPTNMRKELKLLKRIFWEMDFAQVLLTEDEFESFLNGEMEIPEHQWILSDELRYPE